MIETSTETVPKQIAALECMVSVRVSASDLVRVRGVW